MSVIDKKGVYCKESCTYYEIRKGGGGRPTTDILGITRYHTGGGEVHRHVTRVHSSRDIIYCTVLLKKVQN